MAQRVEHFAVTVPAGTTAAAPLEVPINFAPGNVEKLEIVVPNGHAGMTGIALAVAHQPIIPYTIGQFIITNDEIIKWPLDGYPNSGQWSAIVFNTDVTSHTFYIRLLINEVTTLVEPTQNIAAAIPPSTSPIATGDQLPPDTTEPPPDTTPPPDTPTPPDEPAPPDTPPPDDVPAPDIPPPDDGGDIGDVPLDPIGPLDVPPETTDPPPDATNAQLRALLASCRERGRKLDRALRRERHERLKLHDRVNRARVKKGHPHTPAHGLHEIHRHGEHGHPQGHGAVPSAGNSIPGHPEVHAGVAHIVEIIRREYPGLAITSTTGGVHAQGSYHYKGEAVDLASSDSALMQRAAEWIARNLTPYLTEGIHQPGLSVKNGRAVPGSFWGAAVWDEHRNHIHVAVAGAPAHIATAGPPPAHHHAEPHHPAAPHTHHEHTTGRAAGHRDAPPAHHQAPAPAPHHSEPHRAPEHHEAPHPPAHHETHHRR